MEFWKPRFVPSGFAEQEQASSECFLKQNRVALLGIFEWFVLFEEKVHPSECSPQASCFLAQGARGSCLKIALVYASGLASVVLLFVSGVSLLATPIGGLKHLFNSFALGRYAQVYF